MSIAPVNNSSPKPQPTIEPAKPTAAAPAPKADKPAAAAPAAQSFLKDLFKPVETAIKTVTTAPSSTAPKMQDKTSFAVDAGGIKLSSSSTSEGAKGNKTETNSSVQVGPNGVSASASAGGSVTGPKGVKIGFETSLKMELKKDVKSDNGFKVTTTTGDVTATASGNIQGGVFGAGASLSAGNKTTYQVRVSDADFKNIQDKKALAPDPYNPETIPVNGSIKLESKDFKNTHFDATYRQIKLDNDIKEEKGSSMLVQKVDPNTVRVTTGPSDAIENSFKIGVKFGPASASIGNSTKLEGSTLKTAEFDISTAEGKAAYNEFMATGKMPSDNGPGVKNVATTQKVALTSTTDLQAKLGPISFGISNSNGADQTVTTAPDGSKKASTNIDYGSAVPVHIQQAFKPDGTEDTSQQKFTLDLGKVDRGTAQAMTLAFTGDQQKADSAFNDAKNGKNNNYQLNLSPDQVKEMQQRTQDYIKSLGDGWNSSNAQNATLEKFANAKDPVSAMMEIGRGWSGSGSLGEQFLSVALGTGSGGSTFKALSGSIDVS